MDGELVSGSASSDNSEGGDNVAPLKSYGEIFDEQFPRYLAMGMTTEEYWNGDNNLPKMYREADKIKRERRNQEFWLQGLYIYEAMLDVSPVLHAFAKKGVKPLPYRTEPIPVTQEVARLKEEQEEQARYDKAKERMQMFMQANNQKYERGE